VWRPGSYKIAVLSTECTQVLCRVCLKTNSHCFAIIVNMLVFVIRPHCFFVRQERLQEFNFLNFLQCNRLALALKPEVKVLLLLIFCTFSRLFLISPVIQGGLLANGFRTYCCLMTSVRLSLYETEHLRSGDVISLGAQTFPCPRAAGRAPSQFVKLVPPSPSLWLGKVTHFGPRSNCVGKQKPQGYNEE